MKKYLLFAGFALLTIIMIVTASSLNTIKTSPSINHLYIFGDSLSDIGNVFQSTNQTSPPSPPYFQGRYSNGQVWVEYLAKQLGLQPDQSSNFAYGGATTGLNSSEGVPGVLAQVQRFTKQSPKVDPHAAFVIWGGANDYLSGTGTPQRAIDNLTQSLQLLQKAGAQKILVGNLPDLGNLPATRNSGYGAVLNAATQAHNTALNDALKKLNSNGQIVLLDANQLYRSAIATPSKFGFNNVTSTCLNNSACTASNKFLFWDGIHPTTNTHQILGEAAFSALQPILSRK